jgi:branched-chain amino acid transport system permease protein
MTDRPRQGQGPIGSLSWGTVVRNGLIGAAIAVYACLVGIVPNFHQRPLIGDLISLGQAALILTLLGAGYLATRGVPAGWSTVIASGVAGLMAGAGVSVLVVIGQLINLRAVFFSASPALYEIVTFGLGLAGFWIPAAVGALIGAAAGGVALMPRTMRRSLTGGLLALLLAGLFAGLVRTPLLRSPMDDLARFVFASQGLTIAGAAIIFVLVAAVFQIQRQVDLEERIAELPREQRRALSLPLLGVGLVFVLLLPHGLGPFFALVVALVAIYVLMGFGLNITLGLAGLLDLGFVAFFAVGAYTVGLLTSTAEYGIALWPFWAAIPFAVILAMLVGGFLGLPILSIRGDYLAIATLGFGEIIGVLAGSDLLKPFLGGPRGIVQIPKPLDVPPGDWLAGPNQIYYVALICAALVAFIAVRLRASRLGRAWIAIREDEDVAEALGINLVHTKLLAYMLGAAFAGLGGAMFASLVGSIFPSSINLFVSINVAALVIIGGMGSIPGVALGAVFLVGIPELFREFSDYRFLFYGIALIAVMRLRPEGLLPAQIVRRELHVDENVPASGVPAGPSAAS